MLNTFRRRLGLPALLLSVALVAAACGGNGGSDSGGESLSGSVAVSGSSTVEPITGLIAEKFAEENPDVAISVDGPGTGDGFQLFCNGDTDISDASRAIDEEEIALCEQNGIEFVELKVAIDGLSVLTSAENEAVECLSFEQIYALVGPESQGIENWSDANDLAGEVGGEGNLPDAPLTVFGPGEESGTYDSFVELVLEDIAEERGQEPQTRPDYQSSPNDNVIIEGISGNATSFGWVGYAFAETATSAGAKLLEVDGGDGCVEANPETIASGEFPIARPLFIYVNKAKAEENESLSAFVDFYLTEENLTGSVEESGYVPLTADDQAPARDAWENQTVGTQEG